MCYNVKLNHRSKTMHTRLRALKQHIEELRRLAELMEDDSAEQDAAIHHIESLAELGEKD